MGGSNVVILDIGKEFTTHLGTRLRTSGPFSGQEYYEDHLLPAWNSGKTVVVFLDSIEGPTPSFFEEVFGGLVREVGLPEVKKRLLLQANDNIHLATQAWRYMNEAGETKE